MTANEIRASFLKYFEQHGHRAVASAPLVPGDDPTQLFTNAGMNQYKELIRGPSQDGSLRATTTQTVRDSRRKDNRVAKAGARHAAHNSF